MSSLTERALRIREIKRDPGKRVNLVWVAGLQLGSVARSLFAAYANAQVDVVSSAEEALVNWRKNIYDGLVIEHIQGDATMFKLLKAVHQEWVKPITVVVIAANMSHDEQVQYAVSGLRDYHIHDPLLGPERLASVFRHLFVADIDHYLQNPSKLKILLSYALLGWHHTIICR